MALAEGRVQLLHPDRKNAPSISRANFDLFRDAIVQVLSAAPEPLTWTALEQGVKRYLEEHHIDFQGSPGWFAVSVKLHLEATGIIEHFMQKGKKLHRMKQ